MLSDINIYNTVGTTEIHAYGDRGYEINEVGILVLQCQEVQIDVDSFDLLEKENN